MASSASLQKATVLEAKTAATVGSILFYTTSLPTEATRGNQLLPASSLSRCIATKSSCRPPECFRIWPSGRGLHVVSVLSPVLEDAWTCYGRKPGAPLIYAHTSCSTLSRMGPSRLRSGFYVNVVDQSDVGLAACFPRLPQAPCDSRHSDGVASGAVPAASGGVAQTYEFV